MTIAVVAVSGLATRALLVSIPFPPDAQPFRALTIAWTHGHGPRGESGVEYRSALVVPIVEDAARSGILAAFASDVDAFGPTRIDALERLARDLEGSLEISRRLARVERLAPVEREQCARSARERRIANPAREVVSVQIPEYSERGASNEGSHPLNAR